mmetsp:Transcript_1339/g.2923  ORF Transcript_1339/g.2923 Transcript_1339/m.2923 type:complete len:205 (-) Transcript_1339:885-1499(-)
MSIEPAVWGLGMVVLGSSASRCNEIARVVINSSRERAERRRHCQSVNSLLARSTKSIPTLDRVTACEAKLKSLIARFNWSSSLVTSAVARLIPIKTASSFFPLLVLPPSASAASAPDLIASAIRRAAMRRCSASWRMSLYTKALYCESMVFLAACMASSSLSWSDSTMWLARAPSVGESSTCHLKSSTIWVASRSMRLLISNFP